MAFSTILTVIIILYVLGYIGMICYDLFMKKDISDLQPKQEDEDIDISDEAGSFKPIVIDKNVNKPVHKTEDDSAVDSDGVDEHAVDPEESQQTRKPMNQIDDEKSDEVDKNNRTDGSEPLKDEKSDDETDDEKNIDKTTYGDSNTADDNSGIEEENEEEQVVAPPEPRSHKPTVNPVSIPSMVSAVNKESHSSISENPYGDYKASHNSAVPKNIDDRLPMIRIDMSENQTVLTGGTSVEELMKLAKEFADKGKDSQLGKTKIVFEDEVIRKKEMQEEIEYMNETGNNSAPASVPTL